MTLDANLDGVEHINIYSKGVTSLGRNLSNFAHTPFEHPEFGHFESIEGFWFWLKCHMFNGIDHDELKLLSGFQAKKKGTELFIEKEINSESKEIFKENIIFAIKLKLKKHRNILNELISTDLPLKHYYVFQSGKKNEFAKDLPEYKWIVDTIEEIRSVSKAFLKEKNLTNF